jgi:ADP-ribose pyrophosphatase YjhB (NUDIX family)
MPPPRLAARAVLMHADRLLLVNAWPGRDDLWCAPGGGVDRGASLPDTLVREVREETGLCVSIGAPCLVNEFHDPAGTFHQVEVFFRCTLQAGRLSAGWRDPEGIVSHRGFFARAELAGMRVKPASLPEIAWGNGFAYDPLEPILR